MQTHMQTMMGEGGMMDHSGMTGTMPMMDGQGGMMDMGGVMGDMDQMMQMMAQMQTHMQTMMGEGGMMDRSGMTSTMPMTGTMPGMDHSGMTGSAPAANLAAPGADARTSEAGGVTVEIAPLNLDDPQAAALNFAVTMNTHTVDLGVDLARMAILRAGGREINATEWQAPAGGGHHVTGTLVFPAVDAQGQTVLQGPATITLLIRNLAGTPLRSFTWTLSDN